MRIGVFGAGSIGCFVGGRLAAAGYDTVLLGRPQLKAEVARAGLTMTDCDGGSVHVAPEKLTVATEPKELAGADYILVTVKSQDTETAARELAAQLGASTVVVSFQNGVRNPGVLRRGLGGAPVLAGMVPYNVLRKADATFHRGTSGALVIERTEAGHEARLCRALGEAGLAFQVSTDVVGIQWGKLLVNINNAVNALAGIPLKRQLSQLAYRKILSAVMAEGLAVVQRAGIKPVSPIKVPAWVVPLAMKLPDWLFPRVAGAMLKIDPEARSSMWEDLDRRRPTEIDYLNGEIVQLAATHGGEAPLNQRIVALIREAERAAKGSPEVSAEDLAAALGVDLG